MPCAHTMSIFEHAISIRLRKQPLPLKHRDWSKREMEGRTETANGHRVNKEASSSSSEKKKRKERKKAPEQLGWDERVIRHGLAVDCD